VRRPGARNAKTAAQVPQLFFMVHVLLFPLLKGLLQGCHATDLLCNTYCGLHALRGLQPGGRRGVPRCFLENARAVRLPQRVFEKQAVDFKKVQLLSL
jgi:hypothetical protein